MNKTDQKRLIKNAGIILKVCVKAKTAEDILIITRRDKMVYAAALAQAAVRIKANPIIIDITEFHDNGYMDKAICRPLKKAVESADVVLNLQDYAGYSRMMGDLKNNEDRWHTGVDRKIWVINNGMEKWNISERKVAEITTRTLKLIKLLNISNCVRVTSRYGTDFTFYLGKGYVATPVLAICPLYGEVAITPEGKTEHGLIVIDGPTQRGIRPYFELKKEYLKVVVKDGRAISWKGDPTQVKRLTAFIESGKPRADAIDEIGIPTTDFIDNDKYWWTDKTHHHDRIHIALGNNILRNRNIHGIHHMDGEISCATIRVDGKTIMKDGKFKKF